MVRPEKRRQAPVAIARKLLEAVSYIRQQKQIPNLERITKYMQRVYDMGANECRRQLNNTVSDGLITEYLAVGFKGCRTGLEQEGYKIPSGEEAEMERDGHDWYCFECHEPGEVLLCSDCFRVYHATCTKEDLNGSKFTCSLCKEIEGGKKKNKMKKKMLNTLLSYTILRLKEKTRELHKIGSKGEPEDMSRFVYNSMDLNGMEIKVQASRYRCVEEFYADAQIILHNCVLLYGDDKGGMTELARIMLKDCKYDLDEIELCSNCYYMSNAKPEGWFCQPCTPPHELVYAKLKGFGYWPAKVINEVDGKMDVRFFGGWHQRAVIPAEYIRPITTNLRTLTVKRTAGFNKACQELKVHQQLLEEREREMQEQGSTSKQAVDEDEEEKGDDSMDWEEEVEEEVDMRKVTSTSVDVKRQQNSSSPKAASPEESFIVTSSEDKVPQGNAPKTVIKSISSHTQTTKMKTHVVSTQTDIKEENSDDAAAVASELPPATSASEAEWQARLEDAKTEVAENLKRQFEEEKDKALKDLTERLTKDFEEDKQAAVNRAMTNIQREIEKARKTTEEKCKEQYMEEMKKLANKHKEAISATKKRQWCYNCEEEAMYHCCWNTSYCSVRCQQEHWHKEHKRVCRRKR
ncbi:zinc finger MYND domain-containing protein 11-like isoform X1 [Pomacea canaliculata]|uniref:zinc finger MYND domain-containing protein 11-like isoform X1 n=1 Tax=Pomacea canaliculata TaxID=400727 RepID=UPI000D73BDD2|nr:zinc finger MYND domain-containing protein 11-like isoform X1 [Pomacea canaliculata]